MECIGPSGDLPLCLDVNLLLVIYKIVNILFYL